MQDHDVVLRLCLRYQSMRSRQKDYFRTRGALALKESKALEAALDRDVAAYIHKHGRHEAIQTTIDGHGQE